MAFKFYIDNQLTDQPVNDTALVTQIRRDSSIGSLLVTQDVTLVYNGNNQPQSGTISGYTYLKTLLESSICNQATIEIYDQVNSIDQFLIYKGIIKIPQVDIDLQTALLSCKIQDNSYYSYIKNNKEIKVNFAATNTKNQLPLTPIDHYEVDLFNSNGCAYGSSVISNLFYEGFRVIDVFDFIVRAISDNQLTFRSDYLSNMDEELFIFKGQSLVTSFTFFPTAPSPLIEISFQELFNELDKIFNLVFYIDYSGVSPVLRIENYEASYNGDVVFHFDDIKELKVSADTSNLYSSVKVGSNTIVAGSGSGVYSWDSGRSYYGWRIEEFFPLGQCNTESQLDLVNDYIIDSNAIQDTLILQNTDKIDSMFLIQCSDIDTGALTAKGHQFEFFEDNGCYYNLGLNNFTKMQRHSVKFETRFGNFLGVGSNGFRAVSGISAADNITFVTAPAGATNFIPPNTTITLTPMPYNNETTLGGYDGNNNYNILTFRYTLPVDGNYSFLHFLNYAQTGMFAGDFFTITSKVNLYDSGMTLKASGGDSKESYGNGFGNFAGSLVVDGIAGDIVEGEFQISYTPFAGNQQLTRSFILTYLSYLEATGTPDGGVSIATPNTIRKYIYDFTDSVKQSDWRDFILANPTKTITFEKDGIIRSGWVEQIQHNDQTGATQIKLVTNNAIITQ